MATTQSCSLGRQSSAYRLWGFTEGQTRSLLGERVPSGPRWGLSPQATRLQGSTGKPSPVLSLCYNRYTQTGPCCGCSLWNPDSLRVIISQPRLFASFTTRLLFLIQPPWDIKTHAHYNPLPSPRSHHHYNLRDWKGEAQ